MFGKQKKKGSLHHLSGGAVFGFVLGMVVMYLIAKGVIPVGLSVCAAP